MMVVRVFLLLLLILLPLFHALKCDKDERNTVICGPEEYCYLDGLKDRGCSLCKDGAFQDDCHSEKEGLCCCKEQMCNEKVDKAYKIAKIAAIVMGSIAALLLFVVIGLIVYCKCFVGRKEERQYSSVPNDTVAPSKEQVKKEKKVTYKIDEISQDCSMIEHEDYSSVLIEPILDVEDKQDLIDSLKDPQSIPGADEIQSAPRFARLVTYGTTDAITISEEDVAPSLAIPKDDVDFCAYVLTELINNGPRQYHFDLDSLKRVLTIGAAQFAKEQTLLDVQVPCTVYGDIHGQYSDLLRWLNINGWPNKRRSLFLGDFVDRGSHGVEVVAIMCCLKVIFPDGIYVCRGNHEEEHLNKNYTFYSEVENRFRGAAKEGEKIYDYFKKVFINLPLAALVGRRILGMHGGLSPKLNTLQDIRDIKRPIGDFVVGTLACDLVWSDPDTSKSESPFRPNLDREVTTGIGQLFTSEAVEEACKRLDVDLVVRGHQAPLHGYALWADGRLLTLFSAPGYKGITANNVNKGACINVCENGEIVIKQLQVSEEFRKMRILDSASRRKAH